MVMKERWGVVMTKEEWKREWRWHFGFGWSEWPLREERLFQLLKLETWNLKLEINGFCFVWEMGEDNVIDFIHKTQVHYRPRFSSFPLGFFLKIINKSHSLIAHAMSVLICTLSFFSFLFFQRQTFHLSQFKNATSWHLFYHLKKILKKI